MSLNNDQLLDRIVAIEEFLVTLQRAINNSANKTQLTQLVNIRQAEIIALQTEVAELRTAIETLNNGS